MPLYTYQDPGMLAFIQEKKLVSIVEKSLLMESEITSIPENFLENNPMEAFQTIISSYVEAFGSENQNDPLVLIQVTHVYRAPQELPEPVMIKLDEDVRKIVAENSFKHTDLKLCKISKKNNKYRYHMLKNKKK